MYADFESILEPIQGASNDPEISSTRGVNHQDGVFILSLHMEK